MGLGNGSYEVARYSAGIKSVSDSIAVHGSDDECEDRQKGLECCSGLYDHCLAHFIILHQGKSGPYAKAFS